MAWPTVEELKALLDIDGNEWDDHLGYELAAAVAQVKADVGAWADADEPDDALHQAALRAAIVNRVNVENAIDLSHDPVYVSYLTGHRRRFGFA